MFCGESPGCESFLWGLPDAVLARRSSSFSNLSRYLSIRIKYSIDNTSSPHREIVHIRLPLITVAFLGPRARREVTIHDIRKVLGSIHGPEGEADRKELPATGNDRKHLPCSRGVDQVIEPGDCIEERHIDAAGDFGLNVI